MPHEEQLKQLCKRLRAHAMEMTTRCGSGHPTTALSATEIGACLFFGEMHYNTKNPNDPGNDDFVLSKGHATPLLWGLFAEAGIVSFEDLEGYRTFDSPLEGHPTPRMPWIRAATGSLGQGLNVALGMAIANTIQKLPGRVYCLMGDGEIAEGSVWEAVALAADRKQSNLCAIADINALGQSRRTMHEHDVKAYERKFAAFGWNTVCVDGHSISELQNAFEVARKETSKPTIILAKTFKGNGISFLQDQDNWHGKPLPKDKLEAALKELGPLPAVDAKALIQPAHKAEKPALQAVPAALAWTEYKGDEATRKAYGNALAALGAACNAVAAVDGDVQNSTYQDDFFNKFAERSVQCFIAEQNMIGISAGMSAKGLVPYAASFAAFHTRGHDFIRMAAYSNANIKVCGSHVGVSIGEDGASQMGLEDLAMFRGTLNSTVLYPSDAVSAEKLTLAAAKTQGVVYLRTSRPKTPILYKTSEEFPIGGSKVVRSSDRDAVTVVGAGVTLHEAVHAAELLAKDNVNVRVVDCYSVKPLDVEGIRKAAAATGNRVVVVEDHYPEGGIGEAVAAQVGGLTIKHLAVRGVPRSGKPDELLAAFKIDAKAIVEAVKSLL